MHMAVDARAGAIHHHQRRRGRGVEGGGRERQFSCRAYLYVASCAYAIAMPKQPELLRQIVRSSVHEYSTGSQMHFTGDKMNVTFFALSQCSTKEMSWFYSGVSDIRKIRGWKMCASNGFLLPMRNGEMMKTIRTIAVGGKRQ